MPTLVRTAPSGPDWLHEVKHDGYRAISVIDRGKVHIFTRRGLDWSARMPGIFQALAALRVRSAVVDGEVIPARMVCPTSSHFTQRSPGAAPLMVLMVFDIMHLNGEDVRHSPLVERRNMLLSILRNSSPSLRFSHEIGGDGAAAFGAAREIGLEGIVSKRRNSPYRSGKTDAWRKIKCTTTEHFAVIGFEPWGAHSLRSIKLARLVEGELTPCGSAGSGLSIESARDMRAALDAGDAVVAQIEHRGPTPAGELRHPVVRGWERG